MSRKLLFRPNFPDPQTLLTCTHSVIPTFSYSFPSTLCGICTGVQTIPARTNETMNRQNSGKFHSLKIFPKFHPPPPPTFKVVPYATSNSFEWICIESGRRVLFHLILWEIVDLIMSACVILYIDMISYYKPSCATLTNKEINPE